MPCPFTDVVPPPRDSPHHRRAERHSPVDGALGAGDPLEEAAPWLNPDPDQGLFGQLDELEVATQRALAELRGAGLGLCRLCSAFEPLSDVDLGILADDRRLDEGRGA